MIMQGGDKVTALAKLIAICMPDMCFLGHVHNRHIIRLLICRMFYVVMCEYLSPLGSTNSVFNLTIDIGVREVTCQFLNGPVASATCTVQYGTDPTYVNLPNTDSSTGTNVNNMTVPLSTPLLTNTVYYYVVSSMGVRVQGIFRSGMSHYLACRNFDSSKYLVYWGSAIRNIQNCIIRWWEQGYYAIGSQMTIPNTAGGRVTSALRSIQLTHEVKL